MKVFDEVGLAAFERRIRERFEAAGGEADSLGRPDMKAQSARRQWSAVLRTVYLAQRDVMAYVALAEQTGLTAVDCHNVATLLVRRRKPADALAWVDRGLEVEKGESHASPAGRDLAKLRRELWATLGRGDEALAAAWADFRDHPSMYTYDELMQFVPETERSSWHEKAMGSSTRADLHSLIDLLIKTGEFARLADLVRESDDATLRATSHYATEPAAEKLESAHPDLAARLWRAQGLRIVDRKKSKYYDAALLNFDRARRCFERAGLGEEWEKTIADVRARHRRKLGFISESFLERAKARWVARPAKREA